MLRTVLALGCWLAILPASARADDWTPLPVEDNIRDVGARGDNVVALGDSTWRSTDGGVTWKRGGDGPDACARLIAGPKRWWASGCGGEQLAFTSVDDAVTWTAVSGAAQVVILADDGQALWGLNGDGNLTHSDDRGRSWRSRGRPKGCGGNPISVSVATHRLWLTCDEDMRLVSADGGQSFRPADTRRAAADPFDGRVAWANADEGCALVRSTDGGATFRGVLRHSPRVDPETRALSCDENDVFGLPATAGRAVYVVAGGELLASADGVRFETAFEAPFRTRQLFATSRRLLAVAENGVVAQALPVPPSAPVAVPAARKLGPFELGTSWTKLAGLQAERLLASGTTLIASGMGDAWISTDEGRSWTSVPTCSAPQTVVASRKDPRRIWLSGCGADGGVPQPPMVSRDGGKTFTAVPAALGIRVLADDAGVLWGADHGRILRSPDDGTTWIFTGDAMVDEDPTRMLLAPPGMWVADAHGGLMVSKDRGHTWLAPSPDLGDATLVSDGVTLWALKVGGCGVVTSTDGKHAHALFEHDLVFEDAGDYHAANCPPEARVTAMTVDGTGRPWFAVGDRLRRGKLAVAHLPEDATEPLAIAVGAHRIVMTNVDATVWVAPIP